MKVDPSNNPLSVTTPGSSTVAGAKKARQDKLTLSSTAAQGQAGSIPASGSNNARVNISSRAQEMALAKEIARKAPEVRSDRVADLKSRIESGTYRVDSQKVADRMVDDALAEL